jgi:glycosyltransferase involved in cell wall biosynthesis
MNSIATLPIAEVDYDPKWDEKFYTDAKLYDKFIEYPKLSIVIPSFNQGKYIERTIRCILLQNYPSIEVIVIDGNSVDNSLEIIKKYQGYFKYWKSEEDSGMYDALDKGFALASGDVMGWSPTGDTYVSKALYHVGKVFLNQKIKWVTSSFKIKCDEQLFEYARYQVGTFTKESFFSGKHFIGGCDCAKYMIQQQSTFWRKEVWIKSGSSMNKTLRGAGDFELWARFFRHNFELYQINEPVGVFMNHEGQESVANMDNLIREQRKVFEKYGGECKRLSLYERVKKIFRR